MSKPYVIVSPPYDYTSGGIKVMWGLYGALLARGQIVYMNQRPNCPIIGIYPEITQGNPAQAETVVRYILNSPGVMGGSDGQGHFSPGPTMFDPDDIIYSFSRLFLKVPEDRYMFLPVIDTHLFKDQHKVRNKRAVFVGKGQDLQLHKPGAIIVDRSLAQNQQELADLLNECEVIHVYDPVTAMTEIARLCGCRVQMFNPVYSKEEFSLYEPGMNGITWGDEPEVPLDVGAFRSHYDDLRRTFEQKLDSFIDLTQSI